MKKTAKKKNAPSAPAVQAPRDDAGAHGRHVRPLLLWGALTCFFLALFYGPLHESVQRAKERVALAQADLRNLGQKIELFERMTKAGKFRPFEGMDAKAKQARRAAISKQIESLKPGKANKAALDGLYEERGLLDKSGEVRSLLQQRGELLGEADKKLQWADSEVPRRERQRKLALAALALLNLILLYAAVRLRRAGTPLLSLLGALPVQAGLLLVLPLILILLAAFGRADSFPTEAWEWALPAAGWLVLGLFRAPRAYRLREAAHAASGFASLGLTLRNWLGSLDFGLTLLLWRCLRFGLRFAGALLGWGVQGPWRPFLLGSAAWGALELSLVAWAELRGTQQGSLGVGLWLLAIFVALVAHLLWAKARSAAVVEKPRSLFSPLPLALATIVAYLAGVWLVGGLWNGLGSVVLAKAERDFESEHFDLTPHAPPKAVPDAENAAPLLDQAHTAFKALSLTAGGSKQLDLDRDLISKIVRDSVNSGQLTQTAALTAVLGRFQPILALERKALQRPHAAWAMPVKDYNWSMPIPGFYGHLVIARLIAGEGLLALAQGQKASALARVAELRALSALLSEHPSLIAEMTAVAVEGYALDLEGLLLDRGWQAPRADTKRPMAAKAMSAIRWEMAGREEDLKHLSRTWVDGSLFKLEDTVEFKLCVPVLKFWIADQLRASGPLLDELKKEPFPDRAHFDTALLAGGQTKGFLYEHIGFFSEGWRNYLARGLEKDQKALAVSAASQCQAFKKRTGRWPVALWEAVALPAERQDYFNGSSMKLLLRDGGGVLVYSVGSDAKDDQGAPVQPGGQDDLAVTVTRGL